MVPEVDGPGHVNAALASYPELTCSGTAPPLYTGIQVRFGSLCIDKPVTYQFLDDVVGELAALTPGPYIAIGGDEDASTPAEGYATFVDKAVVLGVATHHAHLAWSVDGVVCAHGARRSQTSLEPSHFVVSTGSTRVDVVRRGAGVEGSQLRAQDPQHRVPTSTEREDPRCPDVEALDLHRQRLSGPRQAAVSGDDGELLTSEEDHVVVIPQHGCDRGAVSGAHQ